VQAWCLESADENHQILSPILHDLLIRKKAAARPCNRIFGRRRGLRSLTTCPRNFQMFGADASQLARELAEDTLASLHGNSRLHSGKLCTQAVSCPLG
jgi:hypothetical protein